MRCNNMAGGADGGQGLGCVGVVGWFELSRQSFPFSLLPLPAYYQVGWPSSCQPSLHDVDINAFSYRTLHLSAACLH